MKEVLAEKLALIHVAFKPAYFVLFILIALFSVSLSVVRNQCIASGYEISTLASKLEMKTIIYEDMQKRYFDVMRREVLISKAYNLGFTLPTNNRVYYVQ